MDGVGGVFDGETIFNADHGSQIEEVGKVFVKKPNPVHMIQMSVRFAVETDGGVMRGGVGDWLVHDPVSGHVWPVSDEYKELHYSPMSDK